MKLTKYEHACFTVEKDGKLLVVDPGGWTTDLPALESVVGVVVTHEHPDHFDVTALGAIVAHNPEAVIYAHETITRQFGDTLPHQPVEAGESIGIGPFMLEFFGGEHAVIHPDMPLAANLGVMIDDKVYFPGDSFTQPNKPVDVLALPVTAPWLKISETFDFLTAVKPRFAFPTHDAIASDAGKSLIDRMVPMFAEKVGTTYQRLVEPLEIDE
jgi:L-ascorbate metabolism protein UlaG (beta-lactamase superfamily)